MDFGSFFSNILNIFGGFFAGLGSLLQKTHLSEQVRNVDYTALFSNPWFLVPFLAMVVYLLYKQSFRDLLIIVMIMAAWVVSGTEYMQTLVVGDELQINKVLPVLFGGSVGLGLIIYLLLGRS